MTIIVGSPKEANIIPISGIIDATTSAKFDAAVTDLFGNGNRGPVILDFTGVEHVTSAGLPVLLLALAALSTLERRLALATMNPDLVDVVRLSGFDVFDSGVDNVNGEKSGE